MSRNDYIPSNDMKLLEWVRLLLAYVEIHYERWRIMEPSEDLQALLVEYTARVTAMLNPNVGKVEIREKNLAKAKLVKEIRGFVQGFISRNPFVTEADKLSMGLRVHDTIPTTVLDPVGLATADITFPSSMQLMLHLKPVEKSQDDPRAYYGYRIYYSIYAQGEVPPKDGLDLRLSRFTRRSKERFTFLPSDIGKTAYFSIRYENSKGKAGPWGPMIFAIIP